MMSGVVKEIHERRPDLAGRRERSRVETVGEDGAAALPQSVECARDADEQPLHAARERSPVAGLGEQVEMIRLQREVREPEAEALASTGECAMDGVACVLSAQARKSRTEPHGEMNGMAGAVRRPSVVRDASARACGFAPGAASSASPGLEDEFVLTDASRVAVHAGISSLVRPHETRAGSAIRGKSFVSRGES